MVKDIMDAIVAIFLMAVFITAVFPALQEATGQSMDIFKGALGLLILAIILSIISRR